MGKAEDNCRAKLPQLQNTGGGFIYVQTFKY